MQKIYLLIGIFWALQITANAQCIAVTGCSGSTVTECDVTQNNEQLWNESYWNDPVLNVHDLSESPVDLQISASSTCGGTISIHYELQLDMDGNGTQETVVNSNVAQTPGAVLFNNASGGGTAQAFDKRPVTNNQKYVFALESSLNAGTTTAYVRWNTTATPGVYTVPELPYGVHKIKWIIDDGLGNQEVCAYSFVVKDCKKPTVVCLNGLSVNILPTSMITLFANDFLNYTADNSTPANQLKLGIRKSGQGTGFPVDGNGNPIQSVTYNCLELGTQLVELWAIDKAGNADYCETNVIVQDNESNCGPTTDIRVIACEHRWCDQTVIAGADVTIISTYVDQPNSSLTIPIESDGCMNKLIPGGSSFAVYPMLDTDPLNGVDVFDLIAISKHILGLEPFTSPYAMIAADANKSGSITVFDIVEIRKLILGLYNNFPSNTSWRFVDASFVFPNPNNPFQTQFNETYTNTLPILPGDTISLEFYGIKVGDVNCTAIPGFKTAHGDDRSPTTLLSMPDLLMEAGEVRDIQIQLAEAKRLLGFQMGLQFDPQQLRIEEVQSGLPDFDAATCIAQPTPGHLNSVWFDVNPTEIKANEAMMTLRVRALRTGWLHEMLSITNGADGNLRSEARLSDATRTQLQLDFRTAQSEQDQVVVYTPQPNPTSAGTTIRVQLPETEQVTLQITDLNGKLLYEQRIQLPKGTQTLEVPASAFSQGSVYLWRIETADSRSAGRLIRT
ncbi:MAG: T9SS type A sorting domain-containing protein [Bacteroidota bacterium]